MGYESAKCLAFSAIAASQQGHAFEGLKIFSEAREIFVREKNRAWPSLIDLYRALVFYNEGRLFEARRLAAEALESFRSLNLRTKRCLPTVTGRIALRTEDVEQAFRHGQRRDRETRRAWKRPCSTYQAHLLMGNIHSAGGERRPGILVLSAGPAGPGNPAQQLARRRTEDRLHQEPAGSV